MNFVAAELGIYQVFTPLPFASAIVSFGNRLTNTGGCD